MTDVNQIITKTFDAVNSMMNDDKYDQSKRSYLINITRVVLNSTEYINSIKKQVNQINEDGKVDTNDIPTILTIIVESKEFLTDTINKSIQLTTTIDFKAMKYIIYGVIYFIMTLENVSPDLLIQVKKIYSAVWNIVAMNPDNIPIKVKSCWQKIKCCK